jgi:hypothetical protein
MLPFGMIILDLPNGSTLRSFPPHLRLAWRAAPLAAVGAAIRGQRQPGARAIDATGAGRDGEKCGGVRVPPLWPYSRGQNLCIYTTVESWH